MLNTSVDLAKTDRSSSINSCDLQPFHQLQNLQIHMIIFPGPPVDRVTIILSTIDSVAFRGVNFEFLLPNFDFFRTQYEPRDWEFVDGALVQLNARIGGALEVGVRVERVAMEGAADIELHPFVREFLPRVCETGALRLVQMI